MHRFVEDPATGVVNRLPPHAPAPDERYQPLRFADPPRALQSYLRGRDPRRPVTRSPHGRTTLYVARRLHEATPTLYLADRPGPHPELQRHEIMRPVTADQLHGYAFAPVLRYVLVLVGPGRAAPVVGRREFPQGDYAGALAGWQRLLVDEPQRAHRPETGRLEIWLEVVPRLRPAVASARLHTAPTTWPLAQLLPAFATGAGGNALTLAIV